MNAPRSASANRSGPHAVRRAVLLVMLLSLPVGAQFGPPRPRWGQDPQDDQFDPVAEERRLQTLNDQRQKSMVSDTDRLLKLVIELNNEITRTNPETLSPDQLRKLAEIEKLARSVKTKMGTSVGSTPAFRPAFVPERQ